MGGGGGCRDPEVAPQDATLSSKSSQEMSVWGLVIATLSVYSPESTTTKHAGHIAKYEREPSWVLHNKGKGRRKGEKNN